MLEKSIFFTCAKMTHMMKNALRNENFDKQFGFADEREMGVLFLSMTMQTSQVELARFMQIDKNTMRALIDNLEGKGYVERHKNPQNRKENVIILTQAGKKLAQELLDAVCKHERAFFSMLDDADFATFIALLAKFNAVCGADDMSVKSDLCKRKI